MGKFCAIAESRGFRIDIEVKKRFEVSMAFGLFLLFHLWVWTNVV